MSKIFKDEQDLISIEHAFQNVINTINQLAYYYAEERKTLKKDLKRNIITNDNKIMKTMQEQFEEYTYSLKTIIKVRRIIEDELFRYDLELEESEE